MSEKKNILVLGGGGFIGGHLVNKLVTAGHWVRSVDLKLHEYGATPSEFVQGDLTDQNLVRKIISTSNGEPFDEVYQLAADMGGAGYIFTGENDANVMYNSAIINLNVIHAITELNLSKGLNKTKVFYSSSACMYPEEKQLDTENPGLRESDAYPADPDSEYGWEKLFSERLYLAFNKNNNIPVAIARYHNIYGPEGTWQGGKEKAPAAICRKVIQSDGNIEIWGDGEQTRSFLYIDECIEATRRLMQSDFTGPVNIGSEEMVTINQLVDIACQIEGKILTKKHISGPLGVRGRNSNNDLIKKELGWNFSMTLKEGIEKTYLWIKSQVEKSQH